MNGELVESHFGKLEGAGGTADGLNQWSVYPWVLTSSLLTLAIYFLSFWGYFIFFKISLSTTMIGRHNALEAIASSSGI